MWLYRLWSYSKVSIRKLQIAYHTVFKILLGFSKYDSNSLLCTVFHTRSCSAAIRNYVYKFMCRLATSPNDIIKNIALTILAFTSRIRNHWIELYVGASPQNIMMIVLYMDRFCVWNKVYNNKNHIILRDTST